MFFFQEISFYSSAQTLFESVCVPFSGSDLHRCQPRGVCRTLLEPWTYQAGRGQSPPHWADHLGQCALPHCQRHLWHRHVVYAKSEGLFNYHRYQNLSFNPNYSDHTFQTLSMILRLLFSSIASVTQKKAAEYWMSHSCPHRKRWQAARWMGGRNIWRRTRATRTSGSSSALLTHGCRARWFCRWMGIQEISKMTCSSHMWVK